MFIRFTVRALVCGAILGFACGVWQTSTAILESMRLGALHEASSLHRGFKETSSNLVGSEDRAEPVAGPVPDGEAVKVEAFERFQRKSAEFWTRRYGAELAAAKARIAREAEEARRIAERVNASAARQALRVAREQLRLHNREAARVASRQADADNAAASRIASRQSAADMEAAERIAKMQMDADLQAPELTARQQAELNSRVAQRTAAEKSEINRGSAAGRVATSNLVTTTSKPVPSSWDGQDVPAP